MPQPQYIEISVTEVRSEKARNSNRIEGVMDQQSHGKPSLSEELSIVPDNVVVTDIPVHKRASIQQQEFLAQCMERFPALALSKAKSRHELENSHRKWRQIAHALNNINKTFMKTGKGWLKYWTHLKFKVRRKYAYNRRTGKGTSELTPFEQRLLRILTDDEGNLLCNSAGVELDTVMQVDPEPEDFPAIDDDVTHPVPTERVTIIGENGAGAHETPTLEDTAQMNSFICEDPIGIRKKSIEELQSDILQFKLQSQREMHELEIAQMKERHKLEMEILVLKKKRLTQDIERIKKLVMTVQKPRRGASATGTKLT